MKLTFENGVVRIETNKDAASFSINIGLKGEVEIIAPTVHLHVHGGSEEPAVEPYKPTDIVNDYFFGNPASGSVVTSGVVSHNASGDLVVTADPSKPVVNPSKVSSLDDVVGRPTIDSYALKTKERGPNPNELLKDVAHISKPVPVEPTGFVLTREMCDIWNGTQSKPVVLSEKITCDAFVDLNGRSLAEGFDQEFDPLERFIYEKRILTQDVDRSEVYKAIGALFPHWLHDQVTFGVAQELTNRYMHEATVDELTELANIVSAQQLEVEEPYVTPIEVLRQVLPNTTDEEIEVFRQKMHDILYGEDEPQFVKAVIAEALSDAETAKELQEAVKAETSVLDSVPLNSRLEQRLPELSGHTAVSSGHEVYDRERARKKWLEDGRAARAILRGVY